VLKLLLDGEFLTRARARLWAVGLLVAFVCSIVFLAATAHGLNDFKGRPLGTDFSDVYTAGMLARDGLPQSAYEPATHYRQQQATFGINTPFYGWHYPPFFLGVASVLAAFPYLAALMLWLGLTLGAYVWAMRELQRAGPAADLLKDRVWWLLVLAFPAVFVNLVHGQNAFFTTALIAGGLALLDRKPVAAGILFGLMAYKPQFAVLIPVVLVASGRWKTLAAAAATVAALIAAATLMFGPGIWPAFFGSSEFSRVVVLEQGNTGFEKIQSVFAAVRLVGGPVAAAYGVQAMVSALVTLALVMLWRGQASMELKGAGLCLGVLLATPYCLDYDLVLLAPAIALLAAEGRARGFLRGEVLLLSVVWLMPIAVRNVAGATHVPVGALLVAAAFALIVRRALAGRFVALAA
jgi:hypothetical protein